MSSSEQKKSSEKEKITLRLCYALDYAVVTSLRKRSTINRRENFSSPLSLYMYITSNCFYRFCNFIRMKEGKKEVRGEEEKKN